MKRRTYFRATFGVAAVLSTTLFFGSALAFDGGVDFKTSGNYSGTCPTDITVYVAFLSKSPGSVEYEWVSENSYENLPTGVNRKELRESRGRYLADEKLVIRVSQSTKNLGLGVKVSSDGSIHQTKPISVNCTAVSKSGDEGSTQDDGEKRSDNGDKERSRQEWLTGHAVALRLSPADDNTLHYVQRTDQRRDYRWNEIPNARLTNSDGWYDLQPATRGEPNGTVCRAACDSSERCMGYAYETQSSSSSASVTGGFCGLIFDDAAARWDAAWIRNSKNFRTYVKSNSGISVNVKNIPMVGLRTIGQTIPWSDIVTKTRWGPLLWNENHTGASSLGACAKKCLNDEQCAILLTRALGPDTRCAALGKGSGVTKVEDIGGFRYNSGDSLSQSGKPALNVAYRYAPGSSFHSKGSTFLRVDFSQLLDAEYGLFLFSKNAQDSRHVRAESALVESQKYGIWSDVEPPIERGESDSELATNVEELNLQSFLNTDFADGFLPFNSQVWHSKTEPGTYYYAPARYWFDWDEQNRRLGGAEFFNAKGTIGDGEDVRMQIKLYGGYSPSDLDLFQRVVTAAAIASRLPQPTRLMPYPISDAPTTNLGQAFTGTVASGGVEVAAPSINSTGAPILLTFTVADVNAKALIDSWTDPQQVGGVEGTIQLKSDRVSQTEMDINVTLDPFAAGTYGNTRVENGEWTNTTPFPVFVRSAKAMSIGADSAKIYYWDITSDRPVPPGGKAQISLNSDFPPWILEQTDIIWLDYELDRSCEACAASLFGVGAITGEARSTVTFSVSNSTSVNHNFDVIEVYLRSRYLAPGSDTLNNAAAFELTLAEPSAESPPLYLPNDKQLGYAEDSYSYRAIMYTDDGRELCIPWTTSGRTRIRLSNFVEDAGSCR